MALTTYEERMLFAGLEIDLDLVNRPTAAVGDLVAGGEGKLVPFISTNQARYNHRRDSIVSFIKSYWLSHGYAPTVREMMLALDFSSTSVVNHWLNRLRDDGHILYLDGQSRTLRLPGQRVVFSGDDAQDLPASSWEV